jgi:hypothetical protein
MTSSAPPISTRTAPSGWKASRSTAGSRLGVNTFCWNQVPAGADRPRRAGGVPRLGRARSTLGLFVGINGFEPTAVNLHTGNHSPMILIDGADLYAVLDDLIDLRDLLSRKRRASSMTARVRLTVSEILAGSTWATRRYCRHRGVPTHRRAPASVHASPAIGEPQASGRGDQRRTVAFRARPLGERPTRRAGSAARHLLPAQQALLPGCARECQGRRRQRAARRRLSSARRERRIVFVVVGDGWSTANRAQGSAVREGDSGR